MDSTEGEETPPEVQSEAATGAHSSRTPFIVRGLVFVLLIVVLISVFSEKFFQPQPKGPTLKDDLQKLGLAYHEFHRVREQSPSSMDELKDFLDNPPPPPKATGIVAPDSVAVIVLPDSLIEMIREGRLVVIWQAALTDSGQENDQYLLAYPADAGENGGLGLTAAGRAVELTAEEFKKFPLVKTEQPDNKEPETKQAESEKSEKNEPEVKETQGKE
ncbi:hypothetical protein Pan241w_08880 [Gimesia alba]|uniref:Uncharacterized protein n=1 Tax=Gimesia alba TaxID=2527973 RepID=A0A517RAC2_9PLAN|nr:hypothetical protein [Gimesia alba]QDT40829.1 hypothetical protein Pan241w_08880 [Gimesia alba]